MNQRQNGAGLRQRLGPVAKEMRAIDVGDALIVRIENEHDIGCIFQIET